MHYHLAMKNNREAAKNRRLYGRFFMLMYVCYMKMWYNLNNRKKRKTHGTKKSAYIKGHKRPCNTRF